MSRSQCPSLVFASLLIAFSPTPALATGPGDLFFIMSGAAIIGVIWIIAKALNGYWADDDAATKPTDANMTAPDTTQPSKPPPAPR